MRNQIANRIDFLGLSVTIVISLKKLLLFEK